MWLKKYWQLLIIAVLVITALRLGFGYVSMSLEMEVVKQDYLWAQGSLEQSTKLLVEARKKLVTQPFESHEVMKTWVEAWVAKNMPLILDVGIATIELGGDKELYSDYWDCDDASDQMVRDARIDGYLVSGCLVDVKGYVCGIKVSPYGTHAGCIAMTDNAYWFIEPQTGEIIRIVSRD